MVRPLYPIQYITVPTLTGRSPDEWSADERLPSYEPEPDPVGLNTFDPEIPPVRQRGASRDSDQIMLARQRAVAQIQAAEDARVFAALDAFASEVESNRGRNQLQEPDLSLVQSMAREAIAALQSSFELWTPGEPLV